MINTQKGYTSLYLPFPISFIFADDGDDIYIHDIEMKTPSCC